MSLPDAFLTRPLSHRALHGPGRPENSRAAIRAAIDGGWGIEIDVQGSADGQAMVFHDDALDRLTPETGAVRARPAGELARIPLVGGQDGIPDLPEILDIVGGRVPLLIELKDQTGAMGETDGQLEQAVSAALRGYDGPVAVMSFNPHAVATLATLIPDVPRGLTTAAFLPALWELPAERLVELRAIPDYDRVGASFISHEAADLGANRVSELAKAGAHILCWTIRSPDAETQARKVAHNITFEGYIPA